MGTGFSIDTPVKVAKYGISSVISLVDDTLIEQMRKLYAEKYGEPYTPIEKEDEDARARRITAYLDLLDKIVQKEFADLKASPFEPGSEITKYFELLPETSPVKEQYGRMLQTENPQEKEKLQQELRDQMETGDINVNIMTKLDRMNYAAKNGPPLPQEFSDALAALRGYAKSRLRSAIVFSAGINQRLYSYAAEFKDFYADASGFIKKKIIIKVSDYRSSLIQGKFFAKKGLWVSEYRIESGLNCGGHAFATPGILMGPILEEFKTKKQELVATLYKMYAQALDLKERIIPQTPPQVEITAQGGIGTFEENNFLLTHYNVDSTGWGSPTLLCPEITNVEDETIEKLSKAGEKDVYLSDVSPLGVPFNNLRNSASDLAKEERISKGRPGSACPKGHLVTNTEFTEQPICTASRQYQKLKLEQLAAQDLPPEQYQALSTKIVTKSCICHDLGEAPLIKYHVPTRAKRFSAICPGPNIAYFSKIVTLAEMVGHIYGRCNLLNPGYRPNMFLKELKLNIDYLTHEVMKFAPVMTEKQAAYFREFRKNLLDAIEYYRHLFPQMVAQTQEYRRKALEELQELLDHLESFVDSQIAIFQEPSKAISA